MSARRLALDARLNAYREGGIAEYTRRLAEHLPPLMGEDRLMVIDHRKAQTPLAPAGMRAFTPPHHRLERWAFGAEIAPLRLDLLHSPDFIPPRFGARRYVITVHDLNFLHYPQFQTADSLRYYAGNIAHAARQAAHILADSEATKGDLVNMIGVPPEKITVHKLGVDESYRPLPPAEVDAVRRRLNLPSAYILFVGTFEPRKNLAGLLSAYKHLLDRLPDVPPLVIAGRRGWLYETIFQQAAALGVGELILWREDVPFAAMPALYNGASVVALVSHYEGFGFPILEGMACGVPFVASDRGSLPEVAGEVGLAVNPDAPEEIAAALARALTDSAWR
ncbi:MAG TPA: glycosyltransferase family 1 protein, partial [Aggregatilineales bacterium]|nr:glycosyltransferase family 1 protein [Aggregatilineales bacterium]